LVLKIDYRLDSGQNLQHYLIERSRKGDRKAQNQLYNLYAKAMYNICRRMMGNDEEAKDALQESFIQAFSRMNALKDQTLFGGWLKRIVVNNCIDSLRKRKDFQSVEERNDVSDVESESDDDWSRHQVNRVVRAMDHISEGCRTVLNLYVFEGYDHEEIAKILSISEVTSRAQYSKAKQKIRHILSKELSES